MKRLKKWIFNKRLQLLLKGYDLTKGIEFWMFSSLNEDNKKIQHHKDCNRLLLKLQPEERTIIMDWMKKKIDYLVYQNTKDKTDVMQARLFQALLEHNQIKAVHEAAQMKSEIE